MKTVILDKSSMGYDLDFSVLSDFGEVSVYDTTEASDVPYRIKDADVVLINKIKLGEAQLDASSVKLICEFATGYDNIDVEYCRRRGIAVANVTGYSTDSVTQTTLATVLYLVNHMREYTRSVDSFGYSNQKSANILTPVYHELRGKTWGIVGFGNIGRSVARVAEALGCRVVYSRKSADTDERCVDIDTLCSVSDIITVHTPLSDSTRGIINEERIEKMKDGVILVNEARGAVLVDSAVRKYVENGKIGAFGSDVYSREPLGSDNPLYALIGRDNVCLTPHMAWAAFEARKRCLDETYKNITAFLSGNARNRVDLRG